MTEKKEIESFSFEEAFEELQKVIGELEAGEQPLEKSLKIFEHGQALYQRCTELLNKAELKVQQLNDSGELNNFS